MKTKVRVHKDKNRKVRVSIKFSPKNKHSKKVLNPLEQNLFATECDFDRADELTVRNLK